MFDNKLNYKIINITFLFLLIYIILSNVNLWIELFIMILNLLLPFIISFVLAYAFYPIILKLERMGIKRIISILLLIIFFIILFVWIGIVVFPIIYEQLVLGVRIVMGVINNISIRFNINIDSKVMNYLINFIRELSDFSLGTIINILSKSIGFISNLVICFVSFIYFLLDFDKIKTEFSSLLFRINKKYFNYFKLVDFEISNYIKGLGIFMLIQLVEYSIIFLIVGHPNWLILGILACVLTVVPYFGGLTVNLVAIITASAVSLKLMIITSFICIFFPLLDEYFISPRVYGKTNEVSPLVTIIAVFIGGITFGMLGIILALPCYLFIRTTYYYFKKDLKNSMNILKESI